MLEQSPCASHRSHHMKTLILDNFDSFTYNLFQYCAELGASPEVFRNNEITIPEIEARGYTHIVISPGPGSPETPKDFGICGKVIQHFTGKLPILGVCLGHQGIIHYLGGRVIRAPVPMHGKRSFVHVKGSDVLFAGLPEKIEVMRYHSLIGERESLPAELEVTAETDDRLIMAVSHKTAAVYGVQFHPESVGTPLGKEILQNFFLRAATATARPQATAAQQQLSINQVGLAPHPRDYKNLLSLTEKEAEAFLDEMADGTATEDEMEDILLALARKGESVAEIVGMARGMRKHAVPLPKANEAERITMDTCGTGGSGLPRMNISTTAAFVLAAGGVKIAKHGNRAASGRCGSFDLLEALGVKIDLGPEKVAKGIEKFGIGFLFAPLFHPAMKRIAPVRKRLGIRTIFNLLGPLTNPAGPKYHLLGVPSREIAEKMIAAMQKLGYERAMVVTGEDGLDDITLTGRTYIYDLHNGKVTHSEFSPEEVEIPREKNFEKIAGGNAEQNAKLFEALLQNKGPRALQNLLAINSAFGFLCRGIVPNVHEGLLLAKKIIESGAAYEKFKAYKAFSHL